MSQQTKCRRKDENSAILRQTSKRFAEMENSAIHTTKFCFGKYGYFSEKKCCLGYILL